MAVDTLIRLDRERRLKFRAMDIGELNRRLATPEHPHVGVKQLLQRLADMDLDALVNALHIGLRHEEPRMRLDRAWELFQITCDEDRTREVMQALIEALQNSGVLGSDKQGNAPSPASQPGQSLDS